MERLDTLVSVDGVLMTDLLLFERVDWLVWFIVGVRIVVNMAWGEWITWGEWIRIIDCN